MLWSFTVFSVLQEERRGGRVPAEQQRGEHVAGYPPQPGSGNGELLFMFLDLV